MFDLDLKYEICILLIVSLFWSQLFLCCCGHVTVINWNRSVQTVETFWGKLSWISRITSWHRGCKLLRICVRQMQCLGKTAQLSLMLCRWWFSKTILLRLNLTSTCQASLRILCVSEATTSASVFSDLAPPSSVAINVELSTCESVRYDLFFSCSSEHWSHVHSDCCWRVFEVRFSHVINAGKSLWYFLITSFADHWKALVHASAIPQQSDTLSSSINLIVSNCLANTE